MLTSCVIPIPPTNAVVTGMRDNIGDRVPDFIISNVTTREEVLMHLGQADNSQAGEWQLSYRSGVHRGGILIFVAAQGGIAGYIYGRELHRILIVEFDEAGVVKSTRLQTELCSEHTFGANTVHTSRSCVPIEEPSGAKDAEGQ